jgi:hydrogenase nickel incorporation protein HypB
VLLTSARRDRGVGALLDRALAAADGAPLHEPVMARRPDGASPTPHHHGHEHPHGAGAMAHSHS